MARTDPRVDTLLDHVEALAKCIEDLVLVINLDRATTTVRIHDLEQRLVKYQALMDQHVHFIRQGAHDTDPPGLREGGITHG